MAELVWGAVGDRFFEAGVDRGVLYGPDGRGVVWNGLSAVRETPSGGEISSFYQDGVKYLDRGSSEDFAGTIEAYTYPAEFEAHNGESNYGRGLLVTQQRRLPFSFSYRTLVGNDTNGQDHGYKIHIVYNALVKPNQRDFSSINDSFSPAPLTWDFVTTPVVEGLSFGISPLAHVVIDSTKTSVSTMRYIEARLYGSSINDARIIPLEELLAIFESDIITVRIMANRETGLNPAIVSGGSGDLIGNPSVGLYDTVPGTRLTETGTPGLFTLEGM